MQWLFDAEALVRLEDLHHRTAIRLRYRKARGVLIAARHTNLLRLLFRTSDAAKGKQKYSYNFSHHGAKVLHFFDIHK
jgi:hypothetical protein